MAMTGKDLRIQIIDENNNPVDITAEVNRVDLFEHFNPKSLEKEYAMVEIEINGLLMDDIIPARFDHDVSPTAPLPDIECPWCDCDPVKRTDKGACAACGGPLGPRAYGK